MGFKDFLFLVLLLSGAALTWSVRETEQVSVLPVAKPLVVTTAYRYKSDHVRRNETLSHLMARHNVTGRELIQMLDVAQPKGLNPRRIRPAMTFEFRYPTSTSAPDQVSLRLDDKRYLTLSRKPTGEWRGQIDDIDWTIVTERISGAIAYQGSLDAAIHAAIHDSVMPFKERQHLTWDVAEGVYGWVIDFYRDIRPNDSFSIIYERLVSSEGEHRYGRLLAATIQTGGTANRAYQLTDESGNNLYYNELGRSLHRAFLKAPVAYRYLSSGFGRRFHPVLQRYRAHLGYDFAADLGRPIRATADGVVDFAGRMGGYGIMVAIRHPKDIETRYAHMSRAARGIRQGIRVTQGELIGYVGMTGLATGPHVHYEFLKNGNHVDYRQIDLGDGDPVPAARLAEFEARRLAFDRLLDPPRRATLAPLEWE